MLQSIKSEKQSRWQRVIKDYDAPFTYNFIIKGIFCNFGRLMKKNCTDTKCDVYSL